MNLFQFCFLIGLIPVILHAENKESVSSKNIYVGDTFEYEIEFEKEIPDSLTYPSGDFTEEGEELPLFEVVNSEKKQNSLHLNIRFYSPGEYVLPIRWKDASNTEIAKLKITIKSQLTGKESDIENAEPPIEFTGNYLPRLIFVSVLFLISVYLFYALYLIWRKQRKIVDTGWDTLPELAMRLKKLYLLDELLESEEISFKDFSYLVTTYCKEEYSYRLKISLLHLTDSEFLAYLYDHSGLEEPVLREMRHIFQIAKYAPTIKILSSEEAKILWTEWKSKLKI